MEQKRRHDNKHRDGSARSNGTTAGRRSGAGAWGRVRPGSSRACRCHGATTEGNARAVLAVLGHDTAATEADAVLRAITHVAATANAGAAVEEEKETRRGRERIRSKAFECCLSVSIVFESLGGLTSSPHQKRGRIPGSR